MIRTCIELMKNIGAKMLNPFSIYKSVSSYFSSSCYSCLNTSWFINLMFLISFLFAGFTANSQNAYTFFESYQPFEQNAKGKFSFYFDNVSFFKNNEYKGNIADGYTLTGAWIRPKLSYYPDDKVRVELGGNVLKYNGREDYDNLLPWFNVQYQPFKALSLILGNLDNNRNHNLIEPLLDPERYLTAKPEAGLQVKYNSPRFSLDTWIDWQRFIEKGDPFQEQFAFGAFAALKIIDKNKSEFSFPLTLYGRHMGGEINNSTEPAHSYITITPGLSFKRTLSGQILQSWDINSYYLRCTFPEDKSFFGKSSGWGFYANGGIETHFGGLLLAYWHGHDFYTPQGGILYQNLSLIGNGLVPDNELFNLKYHLDKEIFPSAHLGFMLDLYYDTISKVSMNSEGLYLVINFGVPLKKAK